MHSVTDRQTDRRTNDIMMPIADHHIIIISYIVVLKRKNRLKVVTDKPKLKVKMQSVSDDDDVRKRRLDKLRFDHTV